MKKEITQLERERTKEMQLIGEALRMEMHRQKLNPVDLSAKSGISRPIIDKMFNGGNYNISSLIDVCIALHVKPSIIIKNATI